MKTLNNINYIITDNVLSIIDSYKVKSLKQMINFLKDLRNQYPSKPKSMIIFKRSLFSMINEWRVHNLLYTLNYQTHRTKSVDIDDEPIYRKILYTLLSPFYIHF